MKKINILTLLALSILMLTNVKAAERPVSTANIGLPGEVIGKWAAPRCEGSGFPMQCRYATAEELEESYKRFAQDSTLTEAEQAARFGESLVENIHFVGASDDLPRLEDQTANPSKEISETVKPSRVEINKNRIMTFWRNLKQVCGAVAHSEYVNEACRCMIPVVAGYIFDSCIQSMTPCRNNAPNFAAWDRDYDPSLGHLPATCSFPLYLPTSTTPDELYSVCAASRLC